MRDLGEMCPMVPSGVVPELLEAVAEMRAKGHADTFIGVFVGLRLHAELRSMEERAAVTAIKEIHDLVFSAPAQQ